MIYVFVCFFIIIGMFYSFQFERDKNLKIFFKKREFLILSLSLLCLTIEILIHFLKNNRLLFQNITFTLLFLSPIVGYLIYKLLDCCKKIILTRLLK